MTFSSNKFRYGKVLLYVEMSCRVLNENAFSDLNLF